MRFIASVLSYIKMRKIGKENDRIGKEMRDCIKKQGHLTPEQKVHYTKMLENLRSELEKCKEETT